MSLKDFIAEAAGHGGHLSVFMANNGSGPVPYVAFRETGREIDHATYDTLVAEAGAICNGQQVATVVPNDLVPENVHQAVIRGSVIVAGIDHGGFAMSLTYRL